MKSIYVGNLSHSATEDDRETGSSRGFAFVEMADNNEAASAIKELNLREISGRSITVNEARPKTDKPRGGGGARRW